MCFRLARLLATALAVVVAVGVGLATYELLWGKLFVYSPVKLGFVRHELARTVVYVEDGADQWGFEAIDGFVPDVEAWHGRRFRAKPVIYLFRDRDSYLRRTITKARFTAYPNGSLVISPWAYAEAREGKISLETYVRHELSHLLLFQDMGPLAAYVYFPRWLLEGIAMASADQMGTSWYPSKQATYAAVARGVFMSPAAYGRWAGDDVTLDIDNPIAFAYSEFGCFVDYLMAKCGKDAFWAYVARLENARQPDAVFQQSFGLDFEAGVADFRAFAASQPSPAP